MSVTITDDQMQRIEYYLGELRDGNAQYIMESRRHHDTLVQFMASLRGQTPSRENDEEIIRRNLLIWSPPSCP
jgi:hypothetical protein